MSEEMYYCVVHGNVTDVMKMAFEHSILMDPDTEAKTRVERIYCIKCYVSFLDAQLGEVVPLAKDEEQELSDEEATTD